MGPYERPHLAKPRCVHFCSYVKESSVHRCNVSCTQNTDEMNYTKITSWDKQIILISHIVHIDSYSEATYSFALTRFTERINIYVNKNNFLK